MRINGQYLPDWSMFASSSLVASYGPTASYARILTNVQNGAVPPCGDRTLSYVYPGLDGNDRY